MAGRMERHRRAAERQRLAVARRLRRAGEILAVAQPHQVERLLRRQHRAVARPRMVGMAVRDHGLVDRPRRVDDKSRRACSTRRTASAPAGLRDAWRSDMSYRRREQTATDDMAAQPLFVSSGDLVADRRYHWALDYLKRGDADGRRRHPGAGGGDRAGLRHRLVCARLDPRAGSATATARSRRSRRRATPTARTITARGCIWRGSASARRRRR